MSQLYRSSKESTLFVLALIVSIFAWLALAISLIGLIYGPFIAVGLLLAHAFFLARVTGNGIRLGSRQLPELYKRVEKAAEKLGVPTPEVYIVSGGGLLNAFATKLLSRRFVILNAEIVEACERASEGDERASRTLDFVIGHELGHLALGHLSMSWLLWPAQLVPLLGPAYSRAKEYSADGCGLLCVDSDVEVASRALAVLAAGGHQARQINLEALVEQRHDTTGFIMGLVELNSTHPYLSKRVAALVRIKDPGTAPDVGRNPIAYVAAPFFAASMGGAASYLFIYVAVIGMLAAIAIPNFMKFQERSRASMLDHELGGSGDVGGLGALGTLDDGAAAAAPSDAQGGNALGGLLGDALKPEKVKVLNLVREDGYLYFLDDAGDVARMKIGSTDGASEKVKVLGLVREPRFLYFLDGDGDVARMSMGDEVPALGGLGLGGLGADAAAAAPAELPEPARFEARAWLKQQKAAKNTAAVANRTTAQAMVLVDKLYKAGAKSVQVTDVDTDDEGVYAGSIVAELPAKPALRKKLVDLCTAEFKKQGFTEPCVDEGQTDLFFHWE